MEGSIAGVIVGIVVAIYLITYIGIPAVITASNISGLTSAESTIIRTGVIFFGIAVFVMIVQAMGLG